MKVIRLREGKEFLTGLFYLDPSAPTLHDVLGIEDAPLATLPLERVRPPREALDQIVESLR